MIAPTTLGSPASPSVQTGWCWWHPALPADCGCAPPSSLTGVRLLGLPLGAARAEPFLTTPSAWRPDAPLPRRPVLLDAFCHQGGAGVGYWAAGFDVVGVDLDAQPRYPLEFVQGDAVAFIREHGHRFDAIHCSPPCQSYSRARVLRGPTQARAHPRLIAATREALDTTGRPWIIENVEDARGELRDPLLLCGAMWARRWYRHRLFEPGGGLEAAGALLTMPHPAHTWPVAPVGRPAAADVMLNIVGHFPQAALVRRQVEMPWATRDGIAQAIPPVFTDYLGSQILARLMDPNRGAA